MVIRRDDQSSQRRVYRTENLPEDDQHKVLIERRERTNQRQHAEMTDKEKEYRASKRSRGDRDGRPPRPSHEYQLKKLTESPFSAKIQATLPKHGVHLPKFQKFDPSTTKTYTHLINYHSTISCVTDDDTIICKAFPSSLGRLSLLWFNQLEAGSIHSL